MRLPFEAVAAFIAIFVAAVVLGATLGTAAMVERYAAAHAPAPTPTPQPATPELVAQGRHLFLQNCAHCHASDATGDEGPNLHGVKKSDERITTIIQKGIKGEMPKFGAKFQDADVQALIAYLRSLK
ncbi:MAG TPA: cytochrome c [Chthoniobacteraceae bacterium]|nr:cytochrome c [Chthoniobacteraceae bacterium]